jgi:hypothetical protein
MGSGPQEGFKSTRVGFGSLRWVLSARVLRFRLSIMGLGPLGGVQAQYEEFVPTEKSSGQLRKFQFHREGFRLTGQGSIALLSI